MGPFKGADYVKEIYADLEDAVKDAVTFNNSEDVYLNSIINIILRSITDSQPVFPVLKEPVLFTKIVQWLKEGLEERRKIDEAKKGPIENN